MWLAETYYPVWDAFPAVVVPEVVLLLAVHPRDDFQFTFLSDSQQVFCILMAPLDLTYLLQYLAEQVKQPACNLPRLAPAVLALFPVCQVRLLHVKELCPGTVDSQSAAQLAHRRIALLDPFSQQLRTAESRVHLQEHQGHFPFRREERLAPKLRPHAFPYQSEVLRHRIMYYLLSISHLQSINLFFHRHLIDILQSSLKNEQPIKPLAFLSEFDLTQHHVHRYSYFAY